MRSEKLLRLVNGRIRFHAASATKELEHRRIDGHGMALETAEYDGRPGMGIDAPPAIG